MEYKLDNLNDKQILFKGIDKVKNLLNEIYDSYIVLDENISEEKMKYSIEFLFNNKRIEAIYSLEDTGENTKREAVRIDINKSQMINFEKDMNVSEIIQYLEEKFNMEIISLDPENKDSKNVYITYKNNIFKSIFISGDTYIRAQFDLNLPKALNIFERNSEFIYLD